jgi:hypothetical protein
MEELKARKDFDKAQGYNKWSIADSILDKEENIAGSPLQNTAWANY